MDGQNSLDRLLEESIKEYGIAPSFTQLEKLFKFKDFLIEWNNKINLTAIEDDREVVIKHFSDSLSISPYLPGYKASMIDIGTGAGFPGIPVKVFFDRLEVTLVDSLEKRIKFLQQAIGLLDLTGIETVHARAEDLGVQKEYREKYDVAVARAVASLPVLVEYCLPFVRVGGIFIAMKGSSTDEVEHSGRALTVLGGEIEKHIELELPFSDIKRNIIIIRKLRQTPTKYPRKAGKPSRDPLI